MVVRARAGRRSTTSWRWPPSSRSRCSPMAAIGRVMRGLFLARAASRHPGDGPAAGRLLSPASSGARASHRRLRHGLPRTRQSDQAFRQPRRRRRPVARGREGRVRVAAGPVGLRQDHDPADDRGLRRAERRRDPARGPRPAGGEAGQARPRHRVPELRAVPAHDGGGERVVRARDAGRRGGRAHQARRRDAGAGRARAPSRRASRASSRAASSSGWRSPARW